MIDFKRPPLHPTDQELANFIDNKLTPEKREEVLEHLIYCKDCMKIVAKVKKIQQTQKAVDDINQPQVANVDNQNYANNTDREPQTTSQGASIAGVGYANNWFYSKRVRAIVLSGLVASVVLFMVMSTEDNRPFIEFYTLYNQQNDFRGVATIEIKDIKKANQEINDFLIEITKSTDMSYIKKFNQAEEKRKREEFDDARELYQKAMNIVKETKLDKKEKDKQSIVITYKILLLSIAEGDDESANEYKDVLRDNMRRFGKRWFLNGKN